MINKHYKKMAGTSAVFVLADNANPSPVERDGLIWNAKELHIEELPLERKIKPPMANALSLEGLEDYDKPQNGDIRIVESLGYEFIYLERTHSWIQKTAST